MLSFRRTRLACGNDTRTYHRSPLAVHCTGTVNPDVHATPHPAAAARSVEGTAGRTFRRAGSAPPASSLRHSTAERGSGARPEGDRRLWAGPRATGDPATQSPPWAQKERLPELFFLEDDEDQIERRATAIYSGVISQGKGLVVRSLGRQGAVGAMRLLLKLRAACEAAVQQRDLRFRLLPQEPLSGFGRPLLMFVESVPYRMELPADGSEDLKRITVSARAERAKLEASIRASVTSLKEGQCVVLEMVGSYNIQRGLAALSSVRGELGRVGGSLFVVPTMVSQPPRVKPPAEASAESSSEPAMSGPEAGEGAPVAAAAPVEMVDVLRLYVRWAVPRAEGAAPASAVPLVVPQAPPAAAAPAPAAPQAPAAAGDGQIVVSLAEWESLRGALGSMMEQQRALAQLLEQQQRATAATSTAGGPMPAPQAVAPAQPTTGAA